MEILAAFFIIILATVIVSLQFALHKVEEGHVGVYWRGGALLDQITDPGYHFKVPFITKFSNIQTTMQTDAVTNIPCGTSGGVMVYFEKIEVVNRLHKTSVLQTMKDYGENYDKLWIFEKIHHEINQFCSRHSLQEVYIDLFDTLDESLAKSLQEGCDKYNTGIEIISVRVTKPRIPENIRMNYEKVEAEKTKLMIAMQQQLVIEKEAETERKRATIEAQKKLEVSKIEMSQQVAEKESKQKIHTIEDEMHKDRIKAQADAEFYKRTKEAEADKLRLSTPYLQLQLIQALANNTKIYFGEKIPSMLSFGWADGTTHQNLDLSGLVKKQKDDEP